MLVGGLMLVIVMMFEARKPENWRWMGFSQEGQKAEELPPEDREALAQLDTRYSAQTTGTQTDKGGSLSAERVDGSAELLDSAPAAPQGDRRLFERTETDFWNKQFERWSGEQRQDLFRGLERGSIRRAWQNETERDGFAEAWSQLVEQTDQARRDYETSILRATSDLSDSENVKRQTWLDLLQQLQQQWRDQHEALKAVLHQPSERQAKQLAELLQLLDRIGLSYVKDDVIGSRKEEQAIWFRQFQRLRDSELQWAAAQDRVGIDSEEGGQASGLDESGDGESIVRFQRVNYLQLFEQPDAFRGKPIRMEGDVRRVGFQPASENAYGIDGYHVLWVRPKGKANLPIVVYCRELPVGFPIGHDNEERTFDSGTAEDVIVRGIFFKRWAYEAADDLRLCPLLVADEIEWLPKSETDVAQAGRPTWPVILAMLLSAVVVARLVVRWAKRSADRAASPQPFSFRRASESEDSFDVTEAMRLQDQRSEDSPNEHK